jgi:hypothetical protein
LHLALANQRILNPITGISYRLMASAESWRITRSAPVGTVVSLVHLRGKDGADAIPANLIARFIAGYGIEAAIVAPASAAFRSIVLADFNATSERLTAAVVRARRAYHSGLPGLRPRSPAMRQRFEAAAKSLHDGWYALATAWASGFGSDDLTDLPDWMVAAWTYKGEEWDRASMLETLEEP